jgi:hypothetical protein
MTFIINNEGNILVEKVEGYGSSCLEVTRNLEKALGKADESSRKLTAEFNNSAELDNQEYSKN